MRRPTARIALLIIAILLVFPQAQAQTCTVLPGAVCEDPCPIEGDILCFEDADCPAGFECGTCDLATGELESCTSHNCTCTDTGWSCTALPVPECVAVVPASSDFTIATLALALLLLVSAAGLRRHRSYPSASASVEKKR